ncbi:SHOCT domain-containing protein [Streptomyces sp. NPDC004658]|uniref:SHOCT domain-containing protein n=1 Tax=Streptomyces sp. NPDC004658 TaxID=3154672 RepID=UPI0033BB1BD8
MNAWGWIAMSLGTLLFWALIIAVGVLFFRFSSRPTSADGGHGSWQKAPAGGGPEQILAERYARGEIDEDEYRRRLATLRGSSTDTAGSAAP